VGADSRDPSNSTSNWITTRAEVTNTLAYFIAVVITAQKWFVAQVTDDSALMQEGMQGVCNWQV